ncbi:branched-chain amino acid aminotransferase [Sporosarcina siberiensis]|uniref:Branched-chain amino acid aminotransferase n=1 Tax=Sporosarcina siberiensis TaxID=1365606 RepID=A0ABW4SGF0_9BACL
MLKKKLETYIMDNAVDHTIELPDVVKLYAEQHLLLPDNIAVEVNDIRYDVIELCNKETEEVIRTETAEFLNESMTYLKKNRDEFIFLESKSFELARIDAVALELDDVFETYTALFGLKVQKKFGPDFKQYLDEHLNGDGVKYSVSFSDADGLWDVNFALDYMKGFDEDISINKIVELMYSFVYNMIEALEDAQ